MHWNLATVAHSHSFADGIAYLTGMLMVMACLALLWGLSALIARVVRVTIPTAKPPAPRTPTTNPMPANSISNDPSSDSKIPPHIVAVIAAAVASISKQPVRIVSIKPMNNAWERAGRQTVLTSHRIR